MNQPESPSQTPTLARLFEREVAAGRAVSFCLPGGTPLFELGEEADQLFFVIAGRLVVKLGDAETPGRLGLIRPGEPVGGMAMIAGTAHTTNVFALRDSELMALPREGFFSAVKSDPTLLLELSRLILSRTRTQRNDEAATAPRVFGFLGVSPGLRVRAWIEAVAEAIRRLGHTAAVVGDETGPDTPEWLTGVENAHDFVLYAVEPDEPNWKALVGRQVDAIFNVGAGWESPPTEPAIRALRSSTQADLILIHQNDGRPPQGSAAWLSALAPAHHLHVRQSHQPDIDRVARVITGQAVALVMSGGAARAYAHIGAIRALHESGVPIDLIGGVSMGAVVGAGLAMGWDDAELDQRIRKAFVESSPVSDVALPLVAMTRGDKVRERLAEHFGDRDISDLWLPFFSGTTNLTTGAYQIDRRGLVRQALRSSLSLPGVLPPVMVGDNVLVDGAVLNNFPADVMRTLHGGPIVGVDVGRGRSIEASEVEMPRSILRWFLSGDWRNGPPIVSLLMRAATVTAARDTAAARQATDLLVLPQVDGIEIRDWKAYAPAVTEGRRAMLAALASLDRPVSELRRRPSRAME